MTLVGFGKKEKCSIDRASLYTVTTLGDKIPSTEFNYGVNCHQIELRLTSAWICTVTATSEGLFAPLEGCLYLLGVNIIVLHLFLAQYFQPSIVYIFSCPVEIHLWQSEKHCKANNDLFSIQ
jgi:hypothetical protein